MKSQGIDRVAAGLLLESFEDAFMDWLQAFTMPTLVVCGSEDEDNGSAEELADVLPNAVFREVPGTHMSSVTRPEFGQTIAEFLAHKKGAPEGAPGLESLGRVTVTPAALAGFPSVIARSAISGRLSASAATARTGR